MPSSPERHHHELRRGPPADRHSRPRNQAAIGLLDWEKQEKQRLRIDVAVYRDNFGQEVALEDCYDYSALQAFLAGFADREQIELLETILAEILDYCFKDQDDCCGRSMVNKT